jgi:hypothetical protein
LIDLAVNEDLSIDYLGIYEDTITWQGDVTEDNVMVIASLFNPVANQGYADPPSGNPFEAHFADATAAAIPGETGYNEVNEDFTHTVLVEEATATWCQYCPDMAHALYAIYESEDYPFYFVALVDDKNPDAAQRNDEFNIAGYPTAIFDGGRRVYVGGNPAQYVYRQRIEACGESDPHELNLSVSVEWMGGGELEIDISITNN